MPTTTGIPHLTLYFYFSQHTHSFKKIGFRLSCELRYVLIFMRICRYLTNFLESSPLAQNFFQDVGGGREERSWKRLGIPIFGLSNRKEFISANIPLNKILHDF